MSFRRLIPEEFARLVTDERLTSFRASPFIADGYEVKFRDRHPVRRESIGRLSWDAFRLYEPGPLKLSPTQQERVRQAVARPADFASDRRDPVM